MPVPPFAHSMAGCIIMSINTKDIDRQTANTSYFGQSALRVFKLNGVFKSTVTTDSMGEQRGGGGGS